ncbi:MAG: hypothetical protein M0R33_14035 [Methylomonas sp.]|jgi:hypothetical protein|uniref:hypothetical protein n=1 Tax=Methylomonas sp. TaxID=418 RepID=UPI0025E29C3F|nr:hypothetical protein [Methylomonas sp.]MCK9607556.1 hypothetical protein [Methylomonas sp.]
MDEIIVFIFIILLIIVITVATQSRNVRDIPTDCILDVALIASVVFLLYRTQNAQRSGVAESKREVPSADTISVAPVLVDDTQPNNEARQSLDPEAGEEISPPGNHDDGEFPMNPPPNLETPEYAADQFSSDQLTASSFDLNTRIAADMRRRERNKRMIDGAVAINASPGFREIYRQECDESEKRIWWEDVLA